MTNKRLWLRWVAAICYDIVLCFACLMVASLLAIVLINHGKGIMPSTRWFQGYLISIVLLYIYLGFKHPAGTLGMRAWQLQPVKRTVKNRHQKRSNAHNSNR